MAKKWRWVLLAVAVAFGLWLYEGSQSTAMGTLLEAHDQSDPFWQVQDVIGAAMISEDDQLIFYSSSQYDLIMARMQKSWDGHWHMRGANGSASPKTPGLISQSGTGFDDKWVVFGQIYSDQAYAVKVGDEVAQVVGNPGQTRVYYVVIPREQFSDGLSVKVYDKQWKLLEERS